VLSNEAEDNVMQSKNAVKQTGVDRRPSHFSGTVNWLAVSWRHRRNVR